MTDNGEAVKLYLYDLSKGMAKQMSLQLTGKQIDGIWHTSVVVYDQEFYYGQGIFTAQPGSTHHGSPLEIIDMGRTFLGLEVLNEYINSQRSVYTAEKYHLLDFNCNTFSNDLCQFLTGKSIPGHITDLPSEFSKTPFGQSLLPMIENMFGQSSLASTGSSINATSAPVPAPAPAPSAESLNLLQNVSSAAISTTSSIQTASNAKSLDMWIQSHTAVAVFFTSAGCPPCRVIKPKFESLVEDKHQNGKLLGVIVDTSIARDAGTKYGIRATPTFMFFHKGQKLKDILLYTAYPPHPHRSVILRSVIGLKSTPFVFDQQSQMDKIIGKLKVFAAESDITLNETQKTALNQAKEVVEGNRNIIDVEQWHALADVLLTKLPVDKQFPFLDILRALLKNKHVAEFYTKDCTQLAKVMEHGSNPSSGDPTMLMALRVVCNVFAHPVLATTYFTSHLPEVSLRPLLTQLLIAGLLSEKPQTRKTATSLAFNCANTVALERTRRESGENVGMAEQEDDDWQGEIVCAITHTLKQEQEEDTVHWLLATLAKFLFLAPLESSLATVLITLDIDDLLQSKKQGFAASQKILQLAGDLERLIQKSTCAS